MIEFRYEYILLFYLPLIVIWVLGKINFKNNKILGETDSHLRDRLLALHDLSKGRWKKRLSILSLIILILAASGPQIGTRLTPLERKGVDLVFAIDVSSSMNAEDVKPNRLERAKHEISELIRGLKGDRVAFIVFAGSSHLYLPLTTDYEAARLFLGAIDTEMIDTQGTSFSTAINTGLSAFSEEGYKYKVLVLVTDGEDHEGRAVALARDAKNAGMFVHTVGVGTVSGSLIPVIKKNKPREYKRDSSGKLITSILNEKILIDISKAGGGEYIHFNNETANFHKLSKAIAAMEKRRLKAHMFSEYEDRYEIFAMLSLILFILSIVIPTRSKKSEIWRGRFVQ